MTDADRLRVALLAAIDELIGVVGVPADPDAPYSARVAGPEPLVDREQLPAPVWRAACFGLDVLAMGVSLLEDDGPELSVEEGLALMTKRPGGAES